MIRHAVLLLTAAIQAQALSAPSDRLHDYDIVVYGGTSAGVVSAVQAKRMGKSVVVVCPDRHLGGLSSGGLGWTDTGKKHVIGGIAREFYHRVFKHYAEPEAWRWQPREEYGNRGQGTPAIDGYARTMWIFEPHVAERVFEDLVSENELPVHRDRWLDREGGVTVVDDRIVSIKMLSGETYRGRVFIDATYEGDLMAAAGVSYHVGREGRDVYGEQWNGVQVGVLHHQHYFKHDIDPYRTPGVPSSGLIRNVSADPPGERHDGDERVQAYCFRMCLSDHPENRVPFDTPPEGYDPADYEILVRLFAQGWNYSTWKYDPIPNRKTDTNNHGPFSTDYLGANYDYPDASYDRRREIIEAHRRYQLGLMYFLNNDPRVPAKTRERVSKWGLAKDEFVDNGHWPHQIYVREARRMIGQYVMTEHDCLLTAETPGSIGMGSYTIDSHNVQRYVKPDGFIQNEGDIGVRTPGPYKISYGSLTPKREECENLLVPVCVSSSHIAFGSIRMEPVFMILGQSAATAASIAIDSDVAVQEVPYAELRERLLLDGQVLEESGPPRDQGAGKEDPVERHAINATTRFARQPTPSTESVARVGPNAPNFLLLFADDLGYETLGCYGGQDFETPHLDRLAADGMRFRRAYTSPVCTPSRMSLYTGMYTSRHGYFDVLPVHRGTKRAVDFRQRFDTFPQRLRAAGYATSVTGKWQLAALEHHPDHCREAGFDSWCVWQIWRQGAKTTRYWNPCLNRDGVIQEELAERFGPDVLADYVVAQMKSAVDAGRPFYIHHNMMLPHAPIIDTPAERQSGQPASLGRMIHYMDALCGRILAAVDELGIAERTYVIFMGDNGTDSQAERRTAAGPVAGGKRDLNDAGTHIPLIVRRTGSIAAGVVADDLIDMADWYPTVCELAGVALPADAELDGVSFASRLRGGETSPREWVTAGIGDEMSLFDGRWRIRSGSNVVIDARQTPRETPLGLARDELDPSVHQLRSAMRSLPWRNE